MSNSEISVFVNGKYDALYISRYLLKIANDKKIKITNMKLQKLLYLIQGLFYMETKQILFDDDFVAWNYGPVIPRVYYKYKYNCSEPIVISDDFDDFDDKDIDKIITQIINAVLDTFGKINIWDLVEFTLKAGPWKKYHNMKDDIIPKAEIIKFF